MRTLLAELEHRIGAKLSSKYPSVSWLVEYVIVLLNKYHVNESTKATAYEALHGKEASERLAYFGKRVFFHIPARRRANLDLRWSAGTFLGTLMTSNEAIVGLPNGDVIRTNAIARLMPSQRWKPQAVLGITGTPAKPTAMDYDDSIIESFSKSPPVG